MKLRPHPRICITKIGGVGTMSRRLLLAIWLSLFVVNEAAGTSLRARAGAEMEGGGDDDDDGGGLGGALASMMGGGGGGGGSDDDDDPNMVGNKKQSEGGSNKIDVDGLEKGLASGGVGQLTKMLTLMRAAHGHSETHITKGANGEDMYDFRDLDDAMETTPMPVATVTEMP